MNAYKKLKDELQRELHAFPLFFAFSREQFAEEMAKLGLTAEDTDHIYKFGDTGGFYRRTDAPRLHEMLDRHAKLRQEAIDSDSNGRGYIFDMFAYELANHEYGYTGDISDTLEACGLSYTDIETNPKLALGLLLATQRYDKTTEL